MAEKYSIEVDDFEQRVIVKGLMEYRNELIQQAKPVEDLNDVILKTINAPKVKKMWWKDER